MQQRERDFIYSFTSLGGGTLRNQNNRTFTEFFWGSANQPHQWPLLSINSEICTNPVANFVAGFFEVEMQRCRGGVVRSYMDIYIYFYNCTCSCSSIYFSYFCWYLWSKNAGKGERGVRANMATLPGSPLTSDPSVISTTLHLLDFHQFCSRLKSSAEIQESINGDFRATEGVQHIFNSRPLLDWLIMPIYVFLLIGEICLSSGPCNTTSSVTPRSQKGKFLAFAKA